MATISPESSGPAVLAPAALRPSPVGPLSPQSVNQRRKVGRVLIWFGVAAWVPYGVLRYGLDVPVEIDLFLAAHLAGVIPGCLLSRWDWLRGQLQGS